MNTKHFYKGQKVCLDKESIEEILFDCQSLSSIGYELSKLKNIDTVFGSNLNDMLNEEIFQYDILFSLETHKFYYVKFKEGKFTTFLLPFGTDNKGIDLNELLKKETVLILFNSYELEKFPDEVKKMLFDVENKKLTYENMKIFVNKLNII